MTVKHKNTVRAVMERVLPLAVLMLVLIWLITRYFALKSLENEINESLSSQTQMAAINVAERISSLEDYTRVLSNNDLIINSLIDFSFRENYLHTFFQSLKVPGINKATISLLDYKGRLVAANFPAKSAPATQELVEAAMQGHRFITISPEMLAISLPVFYNGFPEGIMRIQLGIDELKQLFRIDTHLLAVAVRVKPETFLFSTDSFFLNELSQSQRQPESADKEIASSTTWVKTTAAVPGHDSLEIAGGIRAEDIHKHHALMEWIISAAMIIDLFALILGIYISAALTAKPITAFAGLIQEARRNKTLTPNLPQKGVAEMATLARAFNALFAELEQARKEVFAKAVEAGRSQLSAMTLHNVGNAVTPLDPLLNGMFRQVTSGTITQLSKCVKDLEENSLNLPDYITHDTRGKKVFEYMKNLLSALKADQVLLEKKLDKARTSAAHISNIICVHQQYAPAEIENKEMIDINQVLTAAVQLYRSDFQNRNIDIQLKMSPDMDRIKLDKSRFLQVLGNLLKNSCEALDDTIDPGNKKRISIKTFTQGGVPVIQIQDTGSGIAPENTIRIMDLGFSTRGFSGFGLCYCRDFVESNGGTIEIFSRGKGMGSEVTIFFGNRSV